MKKKEGAGSGAPTLGEGCGKLPQVSEGKTRDRVAKPKKVTKGDEKMDPDYRTPEETEIASLFEQGRFKEGLLAYIGYYDHVSFAEISRKFKEHVRGDQALYLRAGSNVILWINLNKAFCDAFSELEHARKIRLGACSWLVYLCDGIALRFPLAKRPPAKGYKKPHWLPVVMVLGGRPKKRSSTN